MFELSIVLALLAFGITCFLGGCCFGDVGARVVVDTAHGANVPTQTEEVTRNERIRRPRMIYAKPGIFSQRVAVPVSDHERLMWRVIKIAILGLCFVLARSCMNPAYAEAQGVELDAGVADYSERDIADLYISNALYREVLVRMVLVRTVIAESGFDLADSAAVLHVLKKRAEMAGIPIESMARRYSSSFRVKPSPRLRWVLAIEPSCSEPDNWPANLRWPEYESKCLASFQLVDAFLRGEVPNPCEGATHFGGRMDDHRAKRAGWARVRCSVKVANRFWRERGAMVDATEARGSK